MSDTLRDLLGNLPRELHKMTMDYIPDLTVTMSDGKEKDITLKELQDLHGVVKINFVKILELNRSTIKFPTTLQTITGLPQKLLGDCHHLFYGCVKFNGDISQWDTSKVTNMARMFHECVEFNQNLNWDTSKVTNMASMFYGCVKFNQNLNWDTSKVTRMARMFYECVKFNQNLNWDTSKVTNMASMFYGCREFNQNLNWNTSKVTRMEGMFYGCREFNQEMFLAPPKIMKIYYA